MRPLRLVVVLGIVCACGPSRAPAAPGSTSGPPVARVADVVERTFGVEVHDPYRWMEAEPNPERDTWMRGQAAYAREVFDRVPGRERLRARMRELGRRVEIANVQLAAGRRFYLATAPDAQVAALHVRLPDGSDRVLVDPAAQGAAGTHVTIDGFAPSPDGRHVAYALAEGGGEIATIHVVDVDRGEVLPDAIERTWGELPPAWLPDGRRFFYLQLRPPRTGVDPLNDGHARLHRLGDAADRDLDLLGGDLPSRLPVGHDEWPLLGASPDGTTMIAMIGDVRAEAKIAIAPIASLDGAAADVPWRAVAGYDDHVERVVAHGDRLYLQTFGDAPHRKVVSVPLADPVLARARLEVAEDADATITLIAGARDALYVQRDVLGRGRLVRVPWGAAPVEVALPADGRAEPIAVDAQADGAAIALETWTRPLTVYTIDGRGAVAATGLASTTDADVSPFVAEETEAVSADGTRVPLSIIRRRDLALDGSHAAILTGYGAYGTSMQPYFDPTRLALLERGVVLAVCHVRGGGERGLRWQEDGSKAKKMNGVHDLEACGRTLIERGLTASARLFVQSGSMGGILVGRAITDAPALFAGAAIVAGEDDPLRILAAENGEGQLAELGDPRTADGFRSILAYDPYVHVTPGTAYPAVILAVGLNDHRVSPWMSAKLAARLQASTTSGRPILLRVDEDAGHGIGSTRDQDVDARADVDAFFLSIAGDPDFRAR